MATPEYKAKQKSYVNDRLVERGDIFSFDGIPSRHWEPLNKEAEAQYAKVKQPKGAKSLKARADKRASDDADKTKKQDPVIELAPAARLKLISDALGKLDHENDGHWTKGGKPDLDTLKAAVGFDVTRGEVEASFSEFLRNA